MYQQDIDEKVSKAEKEVKKNEQTLREAEDEKDVAESEGRFVSCNVCNISLCYLIFRYIIQYFVILFNISLNFIPLNFLSIFQRPQVTIWLCCATTGKLILFLMRFCL